MNELILCLILGELNSLCSPHTVTYTEGHLVRMSILEMFTVPRTPVCPVPPVAPAFPVIP